MMMRNNPAIQYSLCKEEVEDLRTQEAESLKITDILQDLRDFCSECPSNSASGCIDCYLQRWKDQG